MSLSSFTAAVFAVFAFVYPLTSQAATLQVDGSGQLLGADGVDVDGVLYDVDFLDGSCAALFDGCDASNDFTFTTEADAVAASNALEMQVLLDGPSGMFDTAPIQTAGCDLESVCSIYTPYTVNTDSLIGAANLVNLGNVNDVFLVTGFPSGFDTSEQFGAVFAVWEVTTVPLPATGWLILSSFVGFLFVKRRRAVSTA